MKGKKQHKQKKMATTCECKQSRLPRVAPRNTDPSARLCQLPYCLCEICFNAVRLSDGTRLYKYFYGSWKRELGVWFVVSCVNLSLSLISLKTRGQVSLDIFLDVDLKGLWFTVLTRWQTDLLLDHIGNLGLACAQLCDSTKQKGSGQLFVFHVCAALVAWLRVTSGGGQPWVGGLKTAGHNCSRWWLILKTILWIPAVREQSIVLIFTVIKLCDFYLSLWPLRVPAVFSADPLSPSLRPLPLLSDPMLVK